MPQVSQRLNLPGIIKAMLRWTGRLGFTRAAQNVLYRIWAKHVIYMSAFVFDCTHLVCHDQNLGTFIRSGAQGDEGVWPLSQALESLNQNQFSRNRSPSPTRTPLRKKFPLHHAWPTFTIKHHPLGLKDHRPLCSMPMQPQVVLLRLSFFNLCLHPSPFGHMAHMAAHLRIPRYTSDGSVISFFASSSLIPKPFLSS